MPCRARAISALGVCTLLLLGAGCAVRQQRSGYGRTLYAWSDLSGAVRYTSYPERIPVVRLHTMRPVVPGRSAEATAALLPGARTTPDVHPAAGEAPAESAADAADAARRADLESRIAELEVAIARDQETLKILISDPDAAPELRSSQELSTIAERLPKRQAALRALREERARLADSHGP
ncbi:MAG: hypothetical protein OEM49_12970 [Myxococcales bacterium]|nr:hypothetical protein [Myxococcales bacterium]MDH5307519.1 hypothetical protein [Myxococcales bacterium]MDH5566951.1 hypothetical protein [Myxococcales bacterium]